ncbi:MAG: urease accessory protein UreH [Pyrinomonadaceae bacterium]|nr:urease accessory protein UreH [Pyrinomonadaceae bacterium]
MESIGELTTITVLVFGFLLGLKHAVEADHLAAVSTIVAERKNLFSSTIIGGFWGVGHTISLLLVGVLVILLKLQISETTERWFEAIVGLMLVALGLNAIRKLFTSERIHVHTHEHEGHKHTHIHAHEKEEAEETHHFLKLSPRSILIGMVHGLAGSAALMLLIVPTISSASLALIYILVFGIGSIGGMMLMSLLIGLPLHLTAGKFNVLNKLILGGAGLFSLCLGFFIVYAKLFA